MKHICTISYNTKLSSINFCQYLLKIDERDISLTFPQLLQLRRRINELTSPLQLSEIINGENFVLLFVADKQHLLFLEIPQLLDLKDEIESYFCRF